MTEAIEAIVTLLREKWLPDNTGGRRPLIDEIDEVLNPQVKSNNDFVLIYEAANADEYPSLDLSFKDQNWTISCEIRTGARQQRRFMDTEIIRIVDANKTTLTDFSWITSGGRRDIVQDKNRPLYVMSRDINVVKQSVNC